MNIRLKIKPLTYNQYYRNSRSGHRIKTGAGLAYDEELGELLKDYATALANFGEYIDLSKYIVKLTLCHFNPKFYLKDGSRLSKTSGDTDGPIKVIQDKIFNLIGKDDYIVKALEVYQCPASEHEVFIRLDKIAIDDLLLHTIEYKSSRED